MLTVAHAMMHWRPGSGEWGWLAEETDLRIREYPQLMNLVQSIREHGLHETTEDELPIILGSDGRVWSGHHRLIAARIVDPDMLLPDDIEVYREWLS